MIGAAASPVGRRFGWWRLPLRVREAVACAALLAATGVWAGAAAFAAEPPPGPEQGAWIVLPTEIRLFGPESWQQVLVQQMRGSEPGRDVTDRATLRVRDTAVARVENGRLVPVANGKTVLEVVLDGQTRSVPVEVTGIDVEHHWSFRNDVLPVLSKMGCNSGACHGALAGKGGFRLSLRGYDPAMDHFNIVKQDRGRRVNLRQPAASLFLMKPSAAVPHKGGVRFETDSLEYRILAEWIADGAAPPRLDDPRIERLEVLPERSLHEKGESQQILVRAWFDDGTVRDVTRWVKWSSSNEAVARVDQTGRVRLVGPGEGAIVAWYDSRIAMARVTVPFSGPAVEKSQTDSRKPRNFIDELIDSQLARLNLPASAACSDAEFIRRAYIDTIGRLPTAEEVQRFLSDDAKDKRDKLIDWLLEQPEFVDYWTYKWCDVLMLNGTLLRPAAIKAYYMWIRNHVQANTPWDQIVREILTATGESTVNGATNFYALYQTPEDMTENACQAFLGLSINCARCHNHPLEKWTNDQYYAMANLFARVKAKGWGGEPRSGDGLRTVYVVGWGELIQPRTGRPQPPTPLDGEPIPFDDPRDRRIHLARWMTSPENPYFARSITNRVWANFFGVGLVEAVDDMRVSNPPSNPELLDAAARFVIEHKFDLKALMREILRSNAYQRTARPLPGNKDEKRFYSRYYPRRMIAEVLHDAYVQITGVPTKFEFVAFPGGDRQKVDFYPLGTRAIQLYDAAVENYFLQAFGRNQRRIVCECERSNEPTMVQVLHLSNGQTLNEKLRRPGNRVDALMRLRRAGMSDAGLLDRIYLECLARYPTVEERDGLLAVLPPAGDPNERVVLEDILWGILTSREFIFNH